MSIREILDTELEQGCESCGAVRRIPEGDMTVGVGRDGQLDGAVIPLPPCSNCGATEYLIRSPEDEPEHPSPGSFGHRHRLLTDKLHAHLVKTGRVSEGFSNENKPATKEPSKKDLEKWFKDGLRLRRPAEKDVDEENDDELHEEKPKDIHAE